MVCGLLQWLRTQFVGRLPNIQYMTLNFLQFYVIIFNMAPGFFTLLEE